MSGESKFKQMEHETDELDTTLIKLQKLKTETLI